MPVTIIGAKDDLARRTGELLLSSGSPADHLAVFPGKRPAHFLRRYLAEKAGTALRAPRITPMDGFIDLAAEELGFVGRTASPLDMAAVLYSVLKKESCGVISRASGGLTLDSFLPWALKLAGDLEELKIELKTEKDLSAFDPLLPEDLRAASFLKKFEAFSRLYAKFYAELEKSGLLTRSLKYAGAAAGIARFDVRRYGKMVFSGFFALTGAEKAIFRHLEAAGAHILLQDGPGLKEQFSFLGALPASVPAPRPSRPASLHFYKASDTHGEIFKLARTLKAPGPGDVIVLPESRALFPLIEHVLPAAGDYNISMGYPLTATPVYALLDSLGDLLDKRREAGFFVPDYLRFVFHPYVKNVHLEGSAEPGRVVFQTVEERLCARVNKYVRLEDIENDDALLREASEKLSDYGNEAGPEEVKAHLKRVHDALISPFAEVDRLSDFADRLLALLSFVSADSTAPLHPYWAPFLEKAVERIIELKNSRLAAERFSGPSGYFKVFKAFMRDVSYPFPGTPLKGLQVLGLLETRGLKFDRVYFLDANADVLPAVRKEDTVLSHFVRERLGLPTYRTRERVSRYHFGALLAGASEAHIFYKDSAGQERSPFAEELIWGLEREGRRPDESEVHLRMNFSGGDPVPVPKTPEIMAALGRMAFSPSALDAYLNCGLQFYYRYVLRLDERGAVTENIEQRDIGTMAHLILSEFFGARKGVPLSITEKDTAEALELAGRVFDERLKGHNAGFEYLIKRQVERRMKDILAYHRERLAGVRVLACETELKAELPTRYGPVSLKGRADRIDERGGVLHILDYKTGSRAAVPDWRRFDLRKRADWPSTLKSTQLPFYVLAYAYERGMTSVSGMDASLMLLGREKIEEEGLFRERRGKRPDKSAVFGDYKSALVTLVEEILDQDLRFDPSPGGEPCAVCPFKGLCGRRSAAS